MEKIRLDLNELKVESFVTSDLESSSEGTVFQMAYSECQATCDAVFPGCTNFPQECNPNFTDPAYLSCTQGGDPTELGCDTGDCPTDHICSEEPTECCGPTD